MEKDLIKLLKEEMSSSSTERKETREAYLNAIQNQTQKQEQSTKELGDRLEKGIGDLRKDLHQVNTDFTNRITILLTICVMSVLALAGVTVSYESSASTQKINLQPKPNNYEQPKNVK
tara:strand:- start:235 stop:588 length:354 start_codon:yes stop_codon:yes gene_type:complete